MINSTSETFFFENGSFAILLNYTFLNDGTTVNNSFLEIKSIIPIPDIFIDSFNSHINLITDGIWEFEFDHDKDNYLLDKLRPNNYTIEFNAYSSETSNSNASVLFNLEIKSYDKTPPEIKFLDPIPNGFINEDFILAFEIKENYFLRSTKVFINEFIRFEIGPTVNLPTMNSTYIFFNDTIQLPLVEGEITLIVNVINYGFNDQNLSLNLLADNQGPRIKLISPKEDEDLGMLRLIGINEITLKWEINDQNPIVRQLIYFDSSLKYTLNGYDREKTISLPLTGITGTFSLIIEVFDSYNNSNRESLTIQTLPKDNPYAPINTQANINFLDIINSNILFSLTSIIFIIGLIMISSILMAKKFKKKLIK